MRIGARGPDTLPHVNSQPADGRMADVIAACYIDHRPQTSDKVLTWVDAPFSPFYRRSPPVVDPNAVMLRISVPAFFPETRSGCENPSSV